MVHLVGRAFVDPVDAVQGHGQGGAADVHKQGAQNGQGEGQLHVEGHALARLVVAADRAAHGVDDGVDHVQPHAASGNLAYGVGRGESRQKEKLHELGAVELPGHVRRGKAALHHLGPDALQVYAPAVVGHADVEHARPVMGAELQPALGGFACGSPFLGCFQAVVHGIAQQMGEGGFQVFPGWSGPPAWFRPRRRIPPVCPCPVRGHGSCAGILAGRRQRAASGWR